MPLQQTRWSTGITLTIGEHQITDAFEFAEGEDARERWHSEVGCLKDKRNVMEAGTRKNLLLVLV